VDNEFPARIERYLDGDLSAQERAAFEQALQADERLAAEVRLHQAVRLALKAESALERREHLRHRSLRLLRGRLWWWRILDAWEDTWAWRSAQAGMYLPWGRLVAVGATAVLLLLGVWWLLNRTTPSQPAPIAAVDPEVLYQTYFKRVEIHYTLGAAAQEDYTRAQQLYAQGQCAEATALLERLLAEPTFEGRSSALLLKGTCLLEMGHPAEAINILQQVPAVARLPYQRAEWYIALAHLKAGERSAAVAQLRRIAGQPRHLYLKEAKALLGQP
jgi:tetratricopeptide (TPR) repeat protein